MRLRGVQGIGHGLGAVSNQLTGAPCAQAQLQGFEAHRRSLGQGVRHQRLTDNAA